MFQKNKIDYATIKNILDELKRVGHIDFDETIYGQWTFEKVPIMPIIPFEGGAVISEYLDTSSDGIKQAYELSYLPDSINSVYLYVNGLFRREMSLIGKVLMLDFIPSEGSKVFVYYTTHVTIGPEPEGDVAKLIAFMETFIHTNNLLTQNGEIVTHEGNYIEVDI